MANQEERDEQQKSQSTRQGGGDANQSGDPGRTPSKAEGDEQTVDEDLRQKEEQGEI
ncbi:MAG TPA: hypothetical protein VF544_15315 [Pyrinomonadaceae bacterium]